jgi:Sec-independent protein translocase protein TatA
MFGISLSEIAFVFLASILLFGPKDLVKGLKLIKRILSNLHHIWQKYSVYLLKELEESEEK